jgi:HPt (histidine-containing phosphotransfer) domain-containing protein
MAPHKNSAAIVTYGDHEVIRPEHKLRKALLDTPTAAGKDELVARAEAALAGLADEFGAWMEEECNRLDQARNNIAADGLTAANKEQLFRAAHDIKGQAATFGFPAVAAAADSLCRLIEYTPGVNRIPSKLIDHHVDAVRAIYREYSSFDAKDPTTTGLTKDLAANLTADSTKTAARSPAKDLAKKLNYRLREVTDEFLMRENRDRPEVLEQIAGGPSILPE